MAPEIQTGTPSPLVLTMGEPAGIGPDVTIEAWVRRRELRLPVFYCRADPELLRARARLLGMHCPIEEISPIGAADCFDRALPVAALDGRVASGPGRPRVDNAAAVIEAIARGVGDVRSGAASAIVTSPINKKSLYDAGFRHPGHTEFLGNLSAAWTGQPGRPVMMMASRFLNVVPVTIHLPLREVASTLSEALIVETARIVVADLKRRFAIPAPRVAVAGLNPHAGEGGTIGDEDERIIRPAIAMLTREGVAVAGPLSADAMFHDAARATYDVALCMYHDQALIPAKTLSFKETVNVTLGLAFVRTSPDHGTAFDIAGTGKADPSSLAAALRLAAELTRNEARA
ncbi:MAG: 4-hydroxythreonine-4-phosphate dehydrogenase PdxA [Bauldia sp.]